METVLDIQHLQKYYGPVRAVDDISFSVTKGSVWGILGPNGSGKTTTLGIILDVLNANSGSFTWFGGSSSSATRKRIGAILETPNFYPYLSGYKNLEIVAEIRNTPKTKIDEVLSWVGLGTRAKDKFKAYSLGMKQRLAIAGALLGDPEVLILDEPTNGLDPQGIAEVRELILDIASKGITIILASHLLDEVEKVCSHVTVLKSGKIIYNGSVAALTGGSKIAELQAANLAKLEEVLRSWPGFKSAQKQGNKLIAGFEGDVDGARLNSFLMENGVVLSHLTLRKTSLEKQFLEMLKKG